MIVKVWRRVRKLPSRLFRRCLHRVFHFDRWHITALSERKYARDIIAHVNARPAERRGALVEIGCGLGDIISNARYARRLGLDHESNVLRAAAFLARAKCKGRIEWRVFEFPRAELEGRYDVIVLVNWIHHVRPDVLKAWVADYVNGHLADGGEIILDTVQDADYEHNHSIEHLTDALACRVERLGRYERQREVFAISKA